VPGAPASVTATASAPALAPPADPTKAKEPANKPTAGTAAVTGNTPSNIADLSGRPLKSRNVPGAGTAASTRGPGTRLLRGKANRHIRGVGAAAAPAVPGAPSTNAGAEAARAEPQRKQKEPAPGTGTKNTDVNLVKLIEDLKSNSDVSDEQYKIIAEKLLTDLNGNFSKDFGIKIILARVLENCIDFLANTNVDMKLSAFTNFANTFDEFYNEFYDASSGIFKSSKKDEIEKFMKLYSIPTETFLKLFIPIKLGQFFNSLPEDKRDFKILEKLRRPDYLPGPMIYQKYKTDPVPLYFNVATGKFKVSIPKVAGVQGAPLEICSYSLKGIRDVLIEDAKIKTKPSAYGKFKGFFSVPPPGAGKTVRRGGRRSNKTRRIHRK
jgi:hypothetical protein